MKRKRNKPQNPTNISPAIQETSKRTRTHNENSVSDISSNDGSERAESNSSMDSHGYELRSKDPPVFADNNDEFNTNSIPERNLQPQVYFNSNLRKIKIEDDFVPIKEESDEDVEGKHNEIAQINSPSFSVESRDDNTSSTGNDDAENSEFQMLDSERGHLQQEEEEEADDNENEAEDKEGEMKKMSNLEEGIKKYAQEMVSLYRVKTENQTTLQNKVDQLNLVIGQLKTEIQDLSSTLTVQRDKNNQLKSQVVAQQKQNDDLNSRGTLQVDENKQLKSQVVEQQKQIAELNNKLILSAQNQEPTEIHDLNSTETLQLDENNQIEPKKTEQKNQIEGLNTKLKLSAENQPAIENWNSKSNPNAVQIGDIPPKVLSRIFDNLDLKSLKNSRFVCHHWRNEAGKSLLKNFYLVSDGWRICDGWRRCEKSLANLLTNPNLTATSKSKSKGTAQKLWSRERGENQTLKLLRNFPSLRNSIRELKFSSFISTNEHLYEILQLLPNLEILETNKLDLSPTKEWSGDDKSSNKLQLLVQKLQTLKKLKLSFDMTQRAAEHFFHHHQKFASIKSMEIHGLGMPFMRNFMERSLYYLTITRFTLDVLENYDLRVVRRFLLKISPSLQHLKFEWFTPENRPFPLEPWTDDWIIPIGLNRLETLEIIQSFGESKQFAVKNVVAALQLPRLKKLAVGFSSFGRELEETIQNWNGHESANGRKLTSKCLEELEILPTFELTPCKIPAKPWPELKSLKVTWKTVDTFDPTVLSKLRNLERLELIIVFYWCPWESTKNDGANLNQSSNKFQLRGLKKLRSFSLQAPWNDLKHQQFANHLVQNDLKFMKSLQFIEFHGVSIDAEPLKSALGPHVPIIINP